LIIKVIKVLVVLGSPINIKVKQDIRSSVTNNFMEGFKPLIKLKKRSIIKTDRHSSLSQEAPEYTRLQSPIGCADYYGQHDNIGDDSPLIRPRKALRIIAILQTMWSAGAACPDIFISIHRKWRPFFSKQHKQHR